MEEVGRRLCLVQAEVTVPEHKGEVASQGRLQRRGDPGPAEEVGRPLPGERQLEELGRVELVGDMGSSNCELRVLLRASSI